MSAVLDISCRITPHYKLHQNDPVMHSKTLNIYYGQLA